MDIVYKNAITVNEVNSIRAAVGFRQLHPEQLKAGLEGSTWIIAAYDHDKAIGMSRFIWDGGTVALLQDILVVPEYQLLGIEEEMITRCFEFLRAKLKPGFGIQVDVKAWNKQEELYENLGFQVSTPERRGVPMHICLTNQIELTDAMYKQCGFSSKATN